MSRRPARIALLLAASLAGAAPPAAAQQEAPGPPTGGTEASTAGEGLVVRPAALLKRTLAIRGTVDLADAGRTVRIERQAPDGAWIPVAETLIAQDGTFATRWRTDTAGRHTLRAAVVRPGARAAEADAPATARVTVFRRQVASWYGPGFFGRRTACGIKLQRATLGVAHRTLPCGTQVELYHRGRTITVPVIDRGPFVRGRTWDLTAATARAVGVRATVGVGALPAD